MRIRVFIFIKESYQIYKNIQPIQKQKIEAT